MQHQFIRMSDSLKTLWIEQERCFPFQVTESSLLAGPSTTIPRPQSSLQTWLLTTAPNSYHKLSHVHVQLHSDCTHLEKLYIHCHSMLGTHRTTDHCEVYEQCPVPGVTKPYVLLLLQLWLYIITLQGLHHLTCACLFFLNTNSALDLFAF